MRKDMFTLTSFLIFRGLWGDFFPLSLFLPVLGLFLWKTIRTCVYSPIVLNYYGWRTAAGAGETVPALGTKGGRIRFSIQGRTCQTMVKGATSPLHIVQLPSLASGASDSRRQSEREIWTPGLGGKCKSDKQSITRSFYLCFSLHDISANFFVVVVVF